MNTDETGTQLGCTEAECWRTLLIPDKKTVPFNAFVYRCGWTARGSADGMRYFCPQHPPNFGGRKKRKRNT